MDKFFKVKFCERCGAPLNGVRTMSRFNTQTICIKCSEKEKIHPRYGEALKADNEAIRSGNLNFEGIGYEEASSKSI